MTGHGKAILDHLSAGQTVLIDMGPDFEGLRTGLEVLQRRLAQGRFRLAALGQFKRGKSTLLNALLGEPLLPTGVLPLTAVPTVISYGPERSIRIALANGDVTEHVGSTQTLTKILDDYATELGNPGNRRAVTAVEVRHPHPLLRKGLEIIDTPGVGSTVIQNTQAAKAFLPSCDGALFILSPDPPITEVEVQFLSAIKSMTVHVLFVLTKVDLVTPSAYQELLRFLQQVLSQQAGCAAHERILAVSAAQALEGRASGISDLWVSSGMASLESYLNEFLVSEKIVRLEASTRQKAARLLGEALFMLDLKRKVIELPRQELARRAERFAAQLDKLTQERIYIHDRLAGDKARLLEQIDGLTETMKSFAEKELMAAAEKMRCENQPHSSGSALYRAIRDALADEVRNVFSRQREESLRTINGRFHGMAGSHYREMNGLIHRVRQTAADLFEVPHLEHEIVADIEPLREPAMAPERWITSFIEQASAYVAEWLPGKLRDQYLERRLRDDVVYLAARNSGEWRWAMHQNLEEAFRRLRNDVEEQLDEIIQTIRKSVEQTLDRQSQREAAQGPDLHRLEGYRDRLTQSLAAFTDNQASYGTPL